MIDVVSEQRLGQLQHRPHPPIGYPVVDGAPLAARFDKAAPAQTRQMVGNLRLRQPESLDQLADCQLTLSLKQFKDPKPYRIAQAPEVLRNQIGWHRRRWQPERRRTQGRAHARTCIRTF